MKFKNTIYCSKCNNKITANVQTAFEKFNVGKVTCPNCKKSEERYISESDLLLYFGISEILYAIISIVTNFILTSNILIWIRFSIIILILIFYFIFQSYITKLIYIKPFHKKDYMNYVFNENQQAVSKSMSWQFMLFFAIAITFILGETAKVFFGVLMVAAIVLTFVKYTLAIKREKETIKNASK